MQFWKQPPIAKIYEALGALADERIHDIDAHSATVISSTGDKKYLVEWSHDFAWITSNDNASFWQGYLGYPIIAVILKAGKINYRIDIAEKLKGVAWKAINTKYKNKYDLAIAEVLQEIQRNGGNRDDIVGECEQIASELAKLCLMKPSEKRTPSKAPKPDDAQENLI